MKRRCSLVIHLCAVIVVVGSTVGLERCSDATGGGFCPSGNTCCAARDNDDASIQHSSLSSSSSSSACIPADLGAYQATCCHDDNEGWMTGCGVGYTCGPHHTCVAKPTAVKDPLVQRLPRYKLCRAPPRSLQEIYGFALTSTATQSNHDDSDIVMPAYYSSMGPLESLASLPSTAGVNSRTTKTIRRVIFVIHGSGRNADDYYCTMHAAVQQQQQQEAETLIVALRFADTSDEVFVLHNVNGIPMRWNSTNGDWRYGGHSVNNINRNRPHDAGGSGVSSFQVLDEMVSLVLSGAGAFETVRHIKVIGHSAGGQYVQRWALLTDTWKEKNQQQALIQAIVVNPSSFAYLTPLRKSSSSQVWMLPDTPDCPRYNEWEWGLTTTDTSPAYVRQALSIMSLTDIVQRFAQRNVVYLAGDRDLCNVPGMSRQGWCFSHGLETTCMDQLQGHNRLERHMNYFESLVSAVNVTTVHRRALVPGVGHDHGLIFQSQAAATFLFDSHNDNLLPISKIKELGKREMMLQNL